MAVNISKLSLVLDAEAGSIQIAAKQTQQAMASMQQSTKALNNDLAQQREVFRRLNPAITENDKAMDRLVQQQIALQRFRDVLDDDTGLGIGGGHAGMQQAANDVDQLTAKMARFQGVAQQGVFALDDFVAGFSTGGFAGGLRGAANNISMMAMMLGNMRTQLTAIAALAVVQLGMGLWNRENQKRIEAVTDKIKDLADEYDRLLKMAGKNLDVQFQIEDIRKIEETASVREQITSSMREQAMLAAKIATEQQSLSDAQKKLTEAKLGSSATHFFGDAEEEVRLLTEQVDMRSKHIREMNEEFTDQLKINNALNEQLKVTEKIAKQRREAAQWEQNVVEKMFQQNDLWDAAKNGLDELDKRLEGVLNPKDAKIHDIMRQMEADIDAVTQAAINGILSPDEALSRLEQIQKATEMEMRGLNKTDISQFNRLPEAFQHGSAGAISAINQASSGAMNMRDAARALKAQEDTAKNTKGVLDAINKAKNELVAITV